MTTNQIYKDNQKLIERAMSRAMSTIFDKIEPEFDLSTEENIELCEKLMMKWLRGYDPDNL